MKNNILESILNFVSLIVIVAFLLGYPLMLLWNWLMPYLFKLPEITFWQAIGLNFLASILFGKTTTIKKD